MGRVVGASSPPIFWFPDHATFFFSGVNNEELRRLSLTQTHCVLLILQQEIAMKLLLC